MLYDWLSGILNYPIFQYFSVKIMLSFYFSFIVNLFFLKKLSSRLPRDRGKLLSVDGALSKGKPTGAGVIFLTVHLFSVLIFNSFDWDLYLSTMLISAAMIFGFFDDRSASEWGEYRKAAFDLLVSMAGAAVLILWGDVTIWVPFFKNVLIEHTIIQFIIYTLVLWVSINTTNCSDGVDGLSGILVLLSIGSLAILLYFILGNIKISEYLLVPFIADGANWSIAAFSIVASLFAYLWYNAYPSAILMGDAGSRGLGFAIGIIILKTGNPFLYFLISTVLFINGGTGLIKIALKRFLNIHIFKNIRFPLHDHMKENYNWSPTQIMIKFLILQLVITFGVLILIFKVR
ncbi:phospho-N-acetylmuramoyl-pentapeptide-transferase [Spirochaeta isovalerica]|uniref:Phospho-N-acetylmuramoyl-pentapeptide-transferase n=1 Tax=Spirochaeta isovalerica TaxID=150 RepID=A0A841RI90_9SPIO|nr:phospho-N-acetylmuramoyl-pentapeptide-transferase [Spirochaeta isovalerica]MBB6482022.1 phospho-N-acetylmuramoyl-pentapeptide-transferase [Spirochaeta isovalerica]